MPEKKRIYALDNIKGFMMLLVVFGHFLLISANKGTGLTYDIYRLIYCFHMPVFMFVSGLLTHDTDKSWFKKFITLYIIFDAIYYIIGVVYCKDSLSVLNPAYSMWYILLLIVFRFIVKYLPSKKVLLSISIASYFLLPLCNLGDFYIHIKFGSFFIYFVLGYCSQSLFTDAFYSVRKKWEQVIALCVCVGSIAVMYELVMSWNIGFSYVHHATPYATFGMSIESIFFLFLCVVCIYSLMYAMPNKKFVCISMIGKNSLYVYLIHRIITMFIPCYFNDFIWIVISLIASIIISILFGSDLFVNYIRNIKSFFVKEVNLIVTCVLGFSMLFCAASDNATTEVITSDVYPEVVQSDLDNCIKFSYIGDTLLFEEDISRAKLNNFDFSGLYDNTDSYFGDYTFGVFEGIVDYESYSTGNYYDNRLLRLKYPVDLAKTMADHVDFVTLGMNHLMDGGIDDVNNTMTLFQNIGLDFTGAYFSQENNDAIKIIDVDGISIAVLSYSDIMNCTDELESYTYNSFDYDSIMKDIQTAKEANVDMIVAMTHIGTEFSHTVNARQKYWNNILAYNGVDVILSDHAHAVEPVEYIGDTVVFNCPGNYYSSLTGNDQEYGSICNFYVDKDTKKVITTSLVPIKSVVTQTEGQVVTLYDLNDISGTNIVLDNMIGIKVNNLSKEYFYNKTGYCNYYDDTVDNAKYFGDNTVCFIGDSITAGTMNNGHGWYEYLTENYTDVSIGGATTETIIDMLKKDTPSADVYVIAIGCNDIRYYDTSVDDYMSNIETIVNMLPDNAQIYLLSPFYTLRSDSVSTLSYTERNDRIEAYSDALKSYANENNYVFVDMYSYLRDFFENCNNDRLYMVDGVHPNCTSGIKLYSDIFQQSLE